MWFFDQTFQRVLDVRLIEGRLLAIESLLRIFEAIENKDGAEKTNALLTDFKDYAGD